MEVRFDGSLGYLGCRVYWAQLGLGRLHVTHASRPIGGIHESLFGGGGMCPPGCPSASVAKHNSF